MNIKITFNRHPHIYIMIDYELLESVLNAQLDWPNLTHIYERNKMNSLRNFKNYLKIATSK